MFVPSYYLIVTKWIFDGIGIEILILMVSVLISGSFGYKIGTRKWLNRNKKRKIIPNKFRLEEMFTLNSQSQEAGANSTQVIAQNISINNGIDEQRVRLICREEFDVVKRDLTNEAYEKALERVQLLEDSVLPKLISYDKNFQFSVIQPFK